MWFKWAGAILIVIAAALCGNLRAAQMQRRVKQLEEFRLAMRLLMAEIGYTATPLPRALEHVQERLNDERVKREIKETTEQRQLVMSRDGTGEQAVVIEERKPKVKGVLVVARGAENLLIKERITMALAAALDLPTHRISVLPMD